MSTNTNNEEIKSQNTNTKSSSSDQQVNDPQYDQIVKAELHQGVMALYIPLVAFLACVIMAGGVYLIVNNVAFGYFMFGLALVLIISTVIAFYKFQNKLRASGGILDKEDI